MNRNSASTRGDSTPLASSFERYLLDKGKGRGGDGGNYLDAVMSPFAHTAEHGPPPPDLERIRNKSAPTVSDETFAESLTEIPERRRKLRGIVDADARDWPSVQDD